MAFAVGFQTNQEDARGKCGHRTAQQIKDTVSLVDKNGKLWRTYACWRLSIAESVYANYVVLVLKENKGGDKPVISSDRWLSEEKFPWKSSPHIQTLGYHSFSRYLHLALWSGMAQTHLTEGHTCSRKNSTQEHSSLLFQAQDNLLSEKQDKLVPPFLFRSGCEQMSAKACAWSHLKGWV